MAEKLEKMMEGHLNCPVCHERIEDPRFLACGHSFCKGCIDVIIKSKIDTGQNQMECPYCRKKVLIKNTSTGSTISPAKNWMVNDILKTIGDYEKLDSEPIENACKTHPKMEEKFYCKRCEKITCSECAIRDHFHHGDEQPKAVDEISDVFKQRTVDLMDRANEWTSSHNSYATAIEELKKEGLKAIANVEKEVEQEFEIRMQQLKESRDRLLEYLRAETGSFVVRSKVILDREKEIGTRVQQASLMANCRVASGNAHNIVGSYKDWAAKLEKDLTHEVPNTEIQGVEQHLGFLQAFYFEKAFKVQYIKMGSVLHKQFKIET